MSVIAELADSHVHLHAYADPTGLIERARAAGVSLIVGVSVDLASSRRTVEIASRHRGVVAAVGLHPTWLRPCPDRASDQERGIGVLLSTTLRELAALARDPSVGMIGEIGLDTVDAAAPLDLQREIFRQQLVIADRLGRPVSLHLRGAFADAFATLKANSPRAGAVVHYFVGDAALARQALDLGLWISVGKPVSRAENDALRQAIRLVPLDRLLLETDSYPLPGRQTEPADVRVVAEAVAAIRALSVSEVAAVTTANLLRLIGSPLTTTFLAP